MALKTTLNVSLIDFTYGVQNSAHVIDGLVWWGGGICC